MPSLHVIAGCNGSGKSTFAKSFLPNNIQSFDFDKVNCSIIIKCKIVNYVV